MTDLEGEFMKPKLVLIINPDDEGDYVFITLSIEGVTDDGQHHWARMYEQLRIQQQLPDTMFVEPWLLATLAEHTDAIKATLAMRINQGARTLMTDAYNITKDESVGTSDLAAGRQ